jgi:ankyrin repeat protein
MAYEDKDGDTPLFTSFRMGSALCAKILLQRAPTRNTIDKNGWSVLHHAVRMGDVAILSVKQYHVTAGRRASLRPTL